MPAFAKSNVGSERGTTDDEGTTSGQRAISRIIASPVEFTQGMSILLEKVQKGSPHSLRTPFRSIRSGGHHSELICARSEALGCY